MDKSSFSPGQHVKGIESLALSFIDSGSRVVLAGLEHTHQVLDQLEVLAKRLVKIKQQGDSFAHDSRQVFKQQVLGVCEDLTEVHLEVVRGIAHVVKGAIDEAEDIKRSGDTLFKEVFDPKVDLPNPFRAKRPESKRGKETTIIPISIQDN